MSKRNHAVAVIVLLAGPSLLATASTRLLANAEESDEQGCFDYQNAYYDSLAPFDAWNESQEAAVHAYSASQEPMPSGYTEYTSTLNVKVGHPDWRNKVTYQASGHPTCTPP
jgi:hypothetical protein